MLKVTKPLFSRTTYSEFSEQCHRNLFFPQANYGPPSSTKITQSKGQNISKIPFVGLAIIGAAVVIHQAKKILPISSTSFQDSKGQ